jgi:NAD(P)H-hydrate epimerase
MTAEAMTELPRTVYSAAQSRELDRLAIASGIPGYTLMCRAGAAAWACLRRRWPAARCIVVLAGYGNNGGDGYVLAQLARSEGFQVLLLTLGDHSRLHGEAGQAQAAALAAGVPVSAWSGSLPEADVYVDAIFGTGLNKPPRAMQAEAIAALNGCGRPVLALDIPSGLAADSGAEPGLTVRASVTITFICLKLGLLTGRGPVCCGQLEFAGLDIPAAVLASEVPVASRMQPADLAAVLPLRELDGHKGTYGHTLVIGGDHGMGGAISMAAEAAGRAGSGFVSVATRPEHTAMITARHPEIMAHAVSTVEQLLPLLARATVIVLGPGLGQASWGHTLFEAALAAGLPTVVDADGLNMLAKHPSRSPRWVLTPHPGEAARLLGSSTDAVQLNRPAALRELVARYGGAVVLKGSGSLVGDDSGGAAVCPYGNPGMGSGGMGDVLAGVIGALLAQGLSPGQAAQAGVLVHALAGDDAAAEGGERGLQATDLLPHIRRRVNPCTR